MSGRSAETEYGLEVRYADGAIQAVWSPGWVPAGCMVEATVTDAGGQPVSGLTLAYGPGDVVVIDGAPIVSGSTFLVSVSALFPPSPPVGVTVVNLYPPPLPRLSNHAGGILAVWAAVDQATAYQVLVSDGEGMPLSPQPAVTGDYDGVLTQAWVDGATLVDGATYQVQVQATASGSISGLQLGIFIVLDKNASDTPQRPDPSAGPEAVGRRPAFDEAALRVPSVSDPVDYGLEVEYAGYAIKATWLTGWIPAGCTAQVSVTDGLGQPVGGLTLEYVGNNSVIIDGPPIVPGATFLVSVSALFPPSPPVGVTVVNLALPQVPTLSNQAGGILAAWAAVDRATAYQVQVSDGKGMPLSPQPAVTGDYGGVLTQAWVDGATLVDGATYQVQVQASAGGSFSDWGPGGSIVLDAGTPGAPLLIGLLARLKAAGAHFTLDDTLLQAPAVFRLFDALLGHASGIALTGAAVTSEAASVTLTGRGTFFGVADVNATLVFTVSGDALALTLTGSLGPMTVSELYEAGILPGGLYQPADWAAGLGGFAGIDMTLTSDDCAVHFGGRPSDAPWNVLAIAGIALTEVVPAIAITAPPFPGMKAWRPRFTTTLTIGSVRVPVFISVPAGVSGWSVGLDAPDGFDLGSLSALAPLFAGSDAGTNLPGSLIDLGQFWIAGLSIEFVPTQAQVWRLAAELGIGRPGGAGTPVWSIVDGVLALDSIQATLLWTLLVPPGGRAPSASARGSIGGRIVVVGQPIDATIRLPPGPQGWTLRAAADIDLTGGLAQLAGYFGGDGAYLPNVLAPLGSMDSFALSGLSARFQPPPNGALNEITLGLKIGNWTIPAIPWLTLESVCLFADVTNPTVAAARSTTVAVDAVLSIAGAVWLDLSGRYDGATGLLDLEVEGGSVDTVGVSDLSQIVTQAQITDNVPPGLPIDGGFGVGALALTYDTAKRYLPSLELGLESTVPWVIVDNMLVLDAFGIQLTLETSAPGAAPAISGSVVASIALAGVEVTLTAAKPTNADPWTFSAELNEATIDFAALIGQFLGSAVVLPSGYGFPTAITIQSLEASLVPSTKSFRLSGAAFLDWSVAFAGTTFAITGLEGNIDIPGGGAPGTGWFGGSFAFGPMQGAATLMLGDQKTPTVIMVDVSNAGTITPSSQVDLLCGGGTWTSVPAPSDFVDPDFFSARVVLDLTAGSYLVHGAYGQTDNGLYAAVALQVERQKDGSWGFALAAGLANWNFSKISSALSVVDLVLSVDNANAAIALSSIDGDAGPQISRYVPAIGTDFVIRKGLNFCAALTFSGGIMPQVAQLLGITTKGPITLQGFIPADAGASTFTAELGNLTLLDALSFDSLVLTYTTATPRALSLKGVIGLSVPGGSGATSLSFSGSMAVDSASANIAVTQTAQSISNPLGIPGVTLAGLDFSLDYTFATKTVPASWDMAVRGTVSFPGDILLKGTILFQQGSPVVSVVAVSHPLSIDAVFKQLIGSAWPSGLLDITFRDGHIWYAPTAVTVDGTPYDQGFNARSTVTVYSLGNVLLSSRLTASSAGKPGGLTARAQTPAPIDWGFVRFYDPSAPALGPAVSIDSANGVFKVQCGVALFGSPAAECTLSVTNRTMLGTVTVPGQLGPFDNPTLSFSWDNGAGFRVTDWPLQGLQLPNFDFSNLKGSGSCQSTVIDNLPIDSKFNLSASLCVTLEGGTPSLKLTLSGTFDLVANSSVYHGDVITANVAEATLVVPFHGAFTWHTLAQAFITCLQNAAGSIFKNLLEDPANLAKLLAVGGIQFASSEVASYLVCRGYDETTAEEFADAATDAVATPINMAGTVIMVGGVAGSIIGGIFHNSGSSSGGGGGGGGESPPAAPGAAALSWANGLAVSWSGVDNATGYVVSYRTDQHDSNRNTDLIPGTSTTLPVLAGPDYVVRIVASGPGGVSEPGAPASFQSVGAPSALTASFADPTLTVRWSAVAGASDKGYTVSVAEGGAPLSPAPTITFIDTTSCTVTASPFERGGAFTVSVTASSSQMVGPPATASVSIGVLPAPAGLTVSCGAGILLAGWKPLAGAAGYQLRVLDANGKPLEPQPEITVNETTATINGGALVDGQLVEVQVRGTAAGSAGTWCTAVPLTVVWLAAPDNFGLVYDLPTVRITVGFDGVAGASGYEVEILDSTGAPLAPPFTVPVTAPPASFDAGRLLIGTSYQVHLRALANRVTGRWTEPLMLQPVTLAIPTDIAVANTPDWVVVSFATVVNATHYEAEILNAQGQPLNPVLTANGPSPPINVPARGLTPDAVYSVRVRASHVTGPVHMKGK